MSARPRFTKNLQLLLAVLALLPLSVSCVGGGDKEPKLFQDALALLQQGKEELEAGEYAQASNTLEDLIDDTTDLGVALNFDPVAKDQARYSFVMANSLNQINEWINTTSLILNIAIDAGVFGAPGVVDGFNPAALETLGGSGLVAGALDSLLDDFSDFFSKNSEVLAAVKQNPEFSIVYDELPLKFDALGLEVLNLRGEHDLGEAFFLDSIYLLADALLKTLLAVDFTISFSADALPLDYIVPTVQQAFEEENPPFLTLLSNLVAVVMYKQTRLLGLADAQVMKDAGVRYAASFASLGTAIDTILVETDDQTDDVVGRVERDEEVYLKLNLEFGNIIVIDLDTLENLEFLVTEDLQLALGNIEAAFAGEAGQRISWARDIVPVLSVVAAALIRSGFVEVVLEAALSLAGEDPSSIDGISGLLNSDLINENLIEGFLLGLFPDVLELDVGYYFSNPGSGIRDWLPFWNLPESVAAITDPEDNGKVITAATEAYDDMRLFISFECDDEDVSATADTNPTNPPMDGDIESFLCFGDAFENTQIDIDHFTEQYFPEVTTQAFKNAHDHIVFSPTNPQKAAWTNLQEMKDFSDGGAQSVEDVIPPTDDETFGLAADGIRSSLGLVAFRDPSFGGMLYINLTNMGQLPSSGELDAYDFGSTTFMPATNRSLNALFQNLFENIASLVGGL